MKGLFLLLLVFTISPEFVFGQKDTSCFASIYIDRPLVKSDSEVIVRNHISEIKIYSRTVDDSIPTKIYCGKWIIKTNDGKISSTKWVEETNILSGCAPQIKIKYEKNKIIQTLGNIYHPSLLKDKNEEEFRLTHLIDKFGHINITYIDRIGKMKYENRYYYKRIDYRYDGDFLVESDYTTDGIVVEEAEPFWRLYFEYK